MKRRAVPGAEQTPERALGISAGDGTSLAARLVARDELALTELVVLMTPWVLGVAQAVLQDADEAEEVAQETFTIVWDSIGKVPDAPRGLLAWVLRVARNKALDHLRARTGRSHKAAHIAAVTVATAPFAEPREPNEAGTPGWHLHQRIHAALEALPGDQQQVVTLAYFQGLTQSEVAHRLGLPLGTVKTRLRLAFEKLRSSLAPIKDWIA